MSLRHHRASVAAHSREVERLRTGVAGHGEAFGRRLRELAPWLALGAGAAVGASIERSLDRRPARRGASGWAALPWPLLWPLLERLWQAAEAAPAQRPRTAPGEHSAQPPEPRP